MKKNNKVARQSSGKSAKRSLTVGLDLGDRSSRYCVIDETGEVVVEGSTASTRKGLDYIFGALARCRVALEVATHSPWVSRQLTQLGHEVIVAG